MPYVRRPNPNEPWRFRDVDQNGVVDVSPNLPTLLVGLSFPRGHHIDYVRFGLVTEDEETLRRLLNERRRAREVGKVQEIEQLYAKVRDLREQLAKAQAVIKKAAKEPKEAPTE